MKIIKHILSFLLILILQLSFTKSFANVISNEEIGVFNIEYSEKPNSNFPELHFKENYIFEASFLDIVSCRSISYCEGYAKLVVSWKVLDEAKVSIALKRDPVRLEQVDNYLKKNPGAEAAIKKGLDDVGDFKEEFLDGIKNATEDLSHLNGRSALPDEIADAVTKIKQHRIDVNKPSSGNFGYLEGNVKGSQVDNTIWSSGKVNAGEPQIFDATEVGGWIRNTDSEYKMLNKLADDLGGVKGQTYPDINGTLKIVSERPYCASCQGVIQQFNEMFPNIKLILVDGVR